MQAGRNTSGDSGAWRTDRGKATARVASTIHFPLPKSGWGLQGMQEPPSGGNVMQATQASPDTLDAGFAIALA
ncbi:MAG: hypothetical protein ACRDIV_15200, partial [Ktedonobacteraceae bacterium]